MNFTPDLAQYAVPVQLGASGLVDMNNLATRTDHDHAVGQRIEQKRQHIQV